MRKQTGCIYVNGDNWALRWRETAIVDGKETRKLRFKILGEVTSEHRKNRERKTGKLRIPSEIQAAADSLLGVVNSSAGAGSVLLTIGDMVEDRFFPEVSKGWSESSVENYKFLWTRYLKPRISKRIVRDFERADAFRLWAAIHEANPHLRKRSIRQIRAVINSIFRWALDRGLYHGENPARASLPAGLPENKVTEAYSIEEIAAILKVCIDPKLGAVLALLFGSGGRKSEIRGLSWEHYERLEDGAILHIRQQYTKHGLHSPKTKNSVGDITLGEAFCKYVDAYRATLPAGTDSGFLFPGKIAGKPMELQAYAVSKIKPLMKLAGVPWRGGFHAFRRGNSTFVAKALNSEAAAAMSRHTVEMAEQAYIKVNDQQRRGAHAAKVASIESKRAEMRRAAAGALSEGLKTEAVN